MLSDMSRSADGRLLESPVLVVVQDHSILTLFKSLMLWHFHLDTEALTKIEDESAVPVPLLDLQKLLDPERRL